jgi:hypothetical protein
MVAADTVFATTHRTGTSIEYSWYSEYHSGNAARRAAALVLACLCTE